MPEFSKRKTMHINLYDDQIRDYEVVRRDTAITNDNDLVRHLFRRAAKEVGREARAVVEQRDAFR